jgi:CDP-4-dehydro-6-deoxyglucose reductase, E1
MTPNKWDFPTAFSSWDNEEEEAIYRVLDSQNFTMGQEVELFEDEFAKYHGMKYGIMANSGSSANLIAIATLFNTTNTEPLKRNDLAIVPAIAWATTYSPLMQYGLNLYVSDTDDTWNAIHIDSKAEEARLVIGCSVLGNPAYLGEWKEWAGVHDAYFIEDNCESLGATISGKLCGTFGLMNTFSFYYSHQISAIEGGMVLTNDEECFNLCRMLRNHGWTKGVVAPTKFGNEYNFVYPGYNVRPLEMHAAIARVQLQKLDVFIHERALNWEYFRTQVTGLPIQTPPFSADATLSPFGLAFSVESNEIRAVLAKRLRESGIDCRMPTGGSFLKHPYSALWKRDQHTPNADRVHDCGMFLGNAPFPISDKIDKAVKIMKEVL